ncbi:MAG: hypothetical protein M3153_07595 [Chloroflexota bacterium]|nr:hypothetical protein [Chloroflexota bacterium]
MSRAAGVVAILALAVVTTLVILARPPASRETGGSPPSVAASRPPSMLPGTSSPSISAGTADPSAVATFVRHEVGVSEGTYTIFMIDSQGTVTAQKTVSFDRPSRAPVDRVEAANGLIHWRAVVGGLAGWSYLADRSGSFAVREIVRLADGTEAARNVDPNP